MDFYPSEFSREARDRIEREKLLAYRELLPKSHYTSSTSDEHLLAKCIMRIFLAFASEAYKFRDREEAWSLDKIQSVGDEFRRRLTIQVIYEKAPDRHDRWI